MIRQIQEENSYGLLARCPLLLGHEQDVTGKFARRLIRTFASPPFIMAEAQSMSLLLQMCKAGMGGYFCSNVIAEGILLEEDRLESRPFFCRLGTLQDAVRYKSVCKRRKVRMFSYEQMKNLNELEMMIYNYIITHASQVSKMTIRQLAEILNVSSTTILRFCSKLGCEGYSEFKYRFKEYMKRANQQDPSDDFSVIEDFFTKVKEGDLNEEIRRVAEVIYKKDRIFFIGMGTSGTMGKYGARYLSNYGKYAMCLDDPFYPTDNNSYRNTAVVVLSVSGEQRFLFKQVQGLKKGGATIISITNSKKCMLAETADYSLAYYIPMIVLPGLYNVTSSIPVVYILEKLAHDVSNMIKVETEKGKNGRKSKD